MAAPALGGCSTPTSSSRWPKTGQVVPLGSWVPRQAVAAIVRQQRRLPRQPSLYVSMNVSANQFADPAFVAARKVVSASGLAPSALVLEMTESVLLRSCGGSAAWRKPPLTASWHR
jgi:EAL domain-containing protein (putative c-di-GMP-specific phosphodiesterase class I)